MLQQEEPDDFVIATGRQHSVREFATLAAKEFGIDICWRGTGVDEKGYDRETGKVIVAVDPEYFRPTEVESLLGDPTKAKEKLGWIPGISFQTLVSEMAKQDLMEAKRDYLCKNHDFEIFEYNE